MYLSFQKPFFWGGFYRTLLFSSPIPSSPFPSPPLSFLPPFFLSNPLLPKHTFPDSGPQSWFRDLWDGSDSYTGIAKLFSEAMQLLTDFVISHASFLQP